MRLEVVLLPDAIDSVFADLLASRQGAATPVRGSFGLGLHGRLHNSGHLFRRVLRFAPSPGLTLPDRIQALLDKSLTAKRWRVTIDHQFRGELEVLLGFRGGQQDGPAQGNLLRGEMSPDPLLKLG